MTSLQKLELGCGERPTPGYLHQDITPLEGVALDYCCNPWEVQLPQESLLEVVALGVMEHLRFEEVAKTLNHMYEVLQEGGSFLFDVPDMKIWSEYLYNVTHGNAAENPFNDKHVWSTIYGWQRWPGDEHKSGWTRESMYATIQDAGYTKVKEGVSIFTERGFTRGRFTRPGDAHLYFEAIK